jgi:hypothetical protein
VADEVTRHQLSALVGEVSRGRGLHHPAKTRRTEASRPVGLLKVRLTPDLWGHRSPLEGCRHACSTPQGVP